LQFLANPKHIRWQDFWRSLEDIGPKALPIILLIGFLVGVIITFQSAAPFAKFGAQIYIVDLVGLGLVREMGPLMTAIILSGRTASAFAAEIGSMKINQEIDALITMGISPVKFLSIPRILAATLMTPLLSLFLMAAGVVGCFLTMVSLGNNFHMISNELYQIVTVQDFIAGLLKTFVFGAIITSIGCLHGIKTSMGASAVGTSTTKAVVSSLIMLTVADGIFAVVYYALGI
jgi:phospholipid/cholesterol/gamma-HCH transport system permease protein